jgi:hypothetical protein
MTELEAHTMHVVVKEALLHGGRVPVCRELAAMLQLADTHNAVPASLAKLVNDRLLKLNRDHEFLYKKRIRGLAQKAWHLNTAKLVTEPESAYYLITLVENCAPKADRKISKASFHEDLIGQHGFTKIELERIYPAAQQRRYLVEIGDDIRPGERTEAQFRYLHLRARDERQ